MKPRLLDLFCCEGGAAKGYADAGFEVVGVDVEPQPRYPFEFLEQDVMTISPQWIAENFAAVHASPPCQDHSHARHAHGKSHGTGWLLEATLRLACASGLPYVVENVGGATMPAALTLCGTVFDLGLHRHRRFETSFAALSPGCDRSRVRYRGREAEIFGHHGNTDRIREEWGVPWMSQYGIAQSIPPVFTQWLGTQLLDAMRAAA